MKLPGYYSSGEFAQKAHITKKTIRYYDEHNMNSEESQCVQSCSKATRVLG